LKGEIVGMVGIYNKNRSPEEAVPVDKIVQITNDYHTGMQEVQQEYNTLSGQLKNEEDERNQMIQEISLCFEKLERMEKVLVEKAHAKAQQREAEKEAVEGEKEEVKAEKASE
jgi:Mg2+ and Co2+ transporter CorA